MNQEGDYQKLGYTEGYLQGLKVAKEIVDKLTEKGSNFSLFRRLG